MQWIRFCKFFFFLLALSGLHVKAMEGSVEDCSSHSGKLKNDLTQKHKKKESDGGTKKEDRSSESLSSSNLNLPTNSEDQNSKAEERTDTCEHFYRLKKQDEKCNSFLDGRSVRANFQENHPFTQWHANAMADLKKLTPEVRKLLSSRYTDNRNLLKHSVYLISEDNEGQVKEIENKKQDVWISGWPGKDKRNDLLKKVKGCKEEKESPFYGKNFRYFDDSLENSDRDNSPEEKHSKYSKKIMDKYDLKKHSYFIEEKIKYLEHVKERALKDCSFFQQRFLHTEQAIIEYYSTENFKDIIKKFISKEIANQGESEKIKNLILHINIASYNSVCLHCADTMFHEAEWGTNFLNDIQNQFKNRVHLKLRFCVSAYYRLTDYLKSPFPEGETNLKEFVKKLSSNKDAVGYENNEINFMKVPAKRQPYDSNYPYIAHIADFLEEAKGKK